MKHREEITYINSLKFCLAFFVVAIHSSVHPECSCRVYAGFWEALSYYVLSNVVPIFFAISGMMFYRNLQTITISDYIGKLKRRIFTLLIPYIIWNSIGLVLFLIKHSPYCSELYPHYTEIKITLPILLSGYFSLPTSVFPYDFTLWFIRTLIVILPFSPLIGKLIQKCGAYTALIIILVMAPIEMLWPDNYEIVWCVIMFTFGGVVINYGTSLLTSRRLLIWTVGYVAYALLLDVYEAPAVLGFIFRSFKLQLATIVAFKFAIYISECGYAIKRDLMSMTFFIFAFHGLFYTVTNIIIKWLIPPTSNLLCFLDSGLIFTTLSGISIGVWYLLKRIWHWGLKVLCGGR